MDFLWFLLIGLVAGFLAGKLMRGKGFGLVGNLVVGVIGAILGGWVFGLLQIATVGLLGELVAAVAGACLFLFIVSWLTGKRR